MIIFKYRVISYQFALQKTDISVIWKTLVRNYMLNNIHFNLDQNIKISKVS